MGAMKQSEIDKQRKLDSFMRAMQQSQKRDIDLSTGEVRRRLFGDAVNSQFDPLPEIESAAWLPEPPPLEIDTAGLSPSEYAPGPEEHSISKAYQDRIDTAKVLQREAIDARRQGTIGVPSACPPPHFVADSCRF